MIIYLTLNDSPSGIYNSQVIDVVKYLNKLSVSRIKLFAFISIRNFSDNKRKIKSRLPDAVVLPMIPGFRNWKLNRFLLNIICWLYKPNAIIARSVLATYISLYTKKKGLVKLVCHDGRGAIAAEWNEYDVVGDSIIKHEIKAIEEKVVNECDYSIAVSEQLVEYWRKEYSYTGNYFVIPCTLSEDFCDLKISVEKIKQLRSSLGYADDDIILVYSGSSAGWQSFEYLRELIISLINNNQHIKLLFLANPDEKIKSLINQYPSKIKALWVNHGEVKNYLLMSDYGLLVREQTVTNKVASPVKFAEYLSCGLSVLISENIGDYSEFVKDNKCGYVINSAGSYSSLLPVSMEEREKNILLATTFFSKNSAINSKKYNALINVLE